MLVQKHIFYSDAPRLCTAIHFPPHTQEELAESERLNIFLFFLLSFIE